MRNIDVIANSKKLNGKSMCSACYILKTGKECEHVNLCVKCGYVNLCVSCEFDDNDACYRF